jgi:tRNA dimethylallyltransferase
MNKTCIIIAGPTAVGKTSVAITLAQHFVTEIISADSRQCYKELNIGVAKPSLPELAVVHHYFINSHSIRESITAASYENYALQSVGNIFVKIYFAVLAGGTGI